LYRYILKNELNENDLTTHYHAGLILNILISHIKNERSFISDNSLTNAIIKASGMANLYCRSEKKEYKGANTFYRGCLRTYQLFSLFPNAEFYIKKAYELKLTVNKLLRISEIDFKTLIEPIKNKFAVENKIEKCSIIEKLVDKDIFDRINSHINNHSLPIHGNQEYLGIAHERYKTVREVRIGEI